MTDSETSDSRTVAKPTSPFYFTVRIVQTFHVVLELPYDGHPDFVDTEAAAEALDAAIEAKYGALPDDCEVIYAHLESETESWHP